MGGQLLFLVLIAVAHIHLRRLQQAVQSLLLAPSDSEHDHEGQNPHEHNTANHDEDRYNSHPIEHRILTKWDSRHTTRHDNTPLLTVILLPVKRNLSNSIGVVVYPITR